MAEYISLSLSSWFISAFESGFLTIVSWKFGLGVNNFSFLSTGLSGGFSVGLVGDQSPFQKRFSS
ncbi:MAG: hypothetical protein NHB15_17995 [Methanosarcina barkeri]|nr:hypothetical protein [Methanosarcina sp. ERenArc_MAG2]